MKRLKVQIKLKMLVELGVRDAECARVVGCTREYVRQWKIRNGYPANNLEIGERFSSFTSRACATQRSRLIAASAVQASVTGVEKMVCHHIAKKA